MNFARLYLMLQDYLCAFSVVAAVVLPLWFVLELLFRWLGRKGR